MTNNFNNHIFTCTFIDTILTEDELMVDQGFFLQELTRTYITVLDITVV